MPEIGELQALVDEARVLPVGCRVEQEVGRAQACPLLPERRLERDVEAVVDVVTQRDEVRHVGAVVEFTYRSAPPQMFEMAE